MGSIRKISREIRIRGDWLIILVVVAVIAAGYVEKYLLVLLSITLHECMHAVIACFFGGRVAVIRFLPVGLNVDIEEAPLRQRERIWIYIAGPAANLALFMICSLVYMLWFPLSYTLLFVAYTNLYLAVFNLLPAVPLDGGRILRELLAHRVGFYHASRIQRCTSVLIAAAVIAAGILQWMGSLYNFSLLVIGFFVLFTLKTDRMEAAWMNVRNVVYRKERLLRKGIYPSRDLVVLQTIKLAEVVKYMDYDRFHIIHVLDESLQILATFTEQQVLDALLVYPPDVCFEEMLKRE